MTDLGHEATRFELWMIAAVSAGLLLALIFAPPGAWGAARLQRFGVSATQTPTIPLRAVLRYADGTMATCTAADMSYDGSTPPTVYVNGLVCTVDRIFRNGFETP